MCIVCVSPELTRHCKGFRKAFGAQFRQWLFFNPHEFELKLERGRGFIKKLIFALISDGYPYRFKIPSQDGYILYEISRLKPHRAE